MKKDRQAKKQLREGKDWLRMARKVYNYRRDIIAESLLEKLEEAAHDLEVLVGRKKPDPGKIAQAIQKLEPVLRECGGVYYPRSFWADNFETLLVAAILAIGVRTFFFQPFKIPTNSMYPTYHGMTHEVYQPDEDTPGALAGLFRFATLGASLKELDAPADGQIVIPYVVTGNGSVMVPFEIVEGRNFGLFPAQNRRYTFQIGGREATLEVPGDFDMDKVIWERFFKTEGQSYSAWASNSAVRTRVSRSQQFSTRIPGIRGRLGTMVPRETFSQGDRVLAFEILTGDALFVDRFTYNFRSPRAGEPFVFRTDVIPNTNDDKYYIKRLAGEPGDQLRIDSPGLYRNGELAEDNIGFKGNAEQIGEYEGYVQGGSALPGIYSRGFAVPEDEYVALGDNSDESADSRAWGTVPKEAIVGKAFFIYHPFTKRWGPTE